MKGVVDALSRLSGVESVTVKLQENRVIAATDPQRLVLPSAIWTTIIRVGFVPADMEVWATGKIEEHAIALGDDRWPLLDPAPITREPSTLRLRLTDGTVDPPRVTVIH